jgi:hypothetical protein
LIRDATYTWGSWIAAMLMSVLGVIGAQAARAAEAADTNSPKIAAVTEGDSAREGVLTHAQSAYLESCGGCHGLQGVSARDIVPDLRDRVGYWMCTTEGREYIVKLPNVAFADRSDQELADLLNFVVFGLGGPSVQKGAKPYTAEEVRVLRTGASPMITDIKARRRAVMAEMRKACPLPAGIDRPAPGY